MVRLSITLSDEAHRRLKVLAALQDKSIGAIIEEELKAAEREHRRRAQEIAGLVRDYSDARAPAIGEDELTGLAVEETREARREMLEERRSEPSHR